MTEKELSGENGIERPESKSQEPWRYVCPRGHRSWKRLARADTPYYCKQCEEHFQELVDLKTQRPELGANMGGGR